MSLILRLFVLVLLLSYGELYLLVYVASQTSFLITFALCFLTGVLGGAMVRAQGLSTLRAISGNLNAGQLPAQEIVSGLILLVIGTLLMVPGFITDVLGFLFLIPALRSAAAAALIRSFKGRIVRVTTQKGPGPFSSSPFEQTRSRSRPEDIIIDVEPEERD